MKHNLKVTIFLMLLFYSAQFIGLFVVNQSIEEIELINGTIQVNYADVPTGRPETEGFGSFNYLFISILIGTVLVLLLIKYNMYKIWKTWFLLAVGATLFISLSIFIDNLYAFLIGFFLAYLKVHRTNVFIHNITEVFMYSGIAVLLVPIFDVFWMFMALIAISLYDAYAVWKSKHMIKMAEFQSKSKLFAGLNVPYELKKKKDLPPKVPDHKKHSVKIKVDMPKHIKQEGQARSAILGGGDIAFPLLFAGSVMVDLIRNSGIEKITALFQSLPIPLFAGVALFLLFLKSEKGKFYPAMPFITLGCIFGYGIVLLF